MYSFPNLESVCCSMSGSNCCFLTCIQISQEAGQVLWYSHLLKNIVIPTVKGFGIVNKAEIDVFLKLSCFFYDPADVGNLLSGSSAFSKTNLIIWNFMAHVRLKPGLDPTIKIGHETTDWFQIRKGICQGCILSPCLFNLYTE